MSNWFYILKWRENTINEIGKEMNMLNAKFLFKSLKIISEENKSFGFALLSNGEMAKVVFDQNDIGSWEIVEKTENFPTETIKKLE